MRSSAGQGHTGASTSFRIVPRRALASPEPLSSSPASFPNEEGKAPEARVSTSTQPGRCWLSASCAGPVGTVEVGGPTAPFRKLNSWFWKQSTRGLCPEESHQWLEGVGALRNAAGQGPGMGRPPTLEGTPHSPSL